MRLLILGGTVFLGRHLVEATLARGHDVTLFNRGKHNPNLFPAVEKLRGDRDTPGGLDALRGRTWDAVIDTCGYVPRVVRASAEALKDRVGHYTFVSTISVYADTSTPHADETAPLGTLVDPTTAEVTGETYGPLKALCEQAAEETMPGRVLTVRPGLIVGPHDPTDRFTYWPRRVADGGDVLAPERPGVPVQFIDARDLAEWNVRMVEQGNTGVHNATGPEYALTLGAMLDACKTVSGSDARFVWADAEFLEAQGVEAWSDLPVWVPDTPETAGFSTVSVAKAVAEGLRFRTLEQTARDTLDWDRTRPAGDALRAGLTREREREVLAAWRARQAQ